SETERIAGVAFSVRVVMRHEIVTVVPLVSLGGCFKLILHGPPAAPASRRGPGLNRRGSASMNATTGVALKEPALSESEMVAAAERALTDISRVREAVGRVIFGQEAVVERTLVALL